MAMQKFFLVAIVFFVFTGALTSQPVVCAHTQSFYYETGNAVAVTSDGGYIIAGLTAEYGSSPQGEAYLLKFDSLNNIEWGKTIGNTFQASFNDVIQTYDGGYAATGYYESQTGIPHILIVKTDSAGTLQWHKTVGSAANDNGYVIRQMPDSSLIVAGHTFTNCMWTFKISQAGVVDWTRKFIGGSSKLGLGAVITPDSNIVVCGYSSGINSIADPNALIVKYNTQGTLLWSGAWGNSRAELFHTIENSHTSGYMLGGFIADTLLSAGNMMLLAKMDTAGNMVWAKGIGGEYDDRIKTIIKTSDGNYCAAAFTITDTVGIDTYNDILFKFDEAGTILWMKKSADFTGDICNNMKETASKNLILTGNYFADVSVVVADSAGSSCCYSDYTLPQLPVLLNQILFGITDTVYNTYTIGFAQASGGSLFTDCIPVSADETALINTISVFPNPAQDKLTITGYTLNSGVTILKVVDIMGKEIFVMPTSTTSSTLSTKQLKPGIYFIEAGLVRIKFIKQ